MKLAGITLVVLALGSTLGCQPKQESAPPPAPAAAASPADASAPPPASPATAAGPESAAPATAPASAAAPATAPAAAPAASSTVADLPDYPGATRVKLENEAKGGFAKRTEVELSTSDPFEKVKKFYLDAIAANGWQVTGTKEKAGEVKWHLSKGTSVGKVEIETGHHAAGLRIKLERMDR